MSDGQSTAKRDIKDIELVNTKNGTTIDHLDYGKETSYRNYFGFHYNEESKNVLRVVFKTDELNKRFVLSDYYALTESILKDNVLMRTLIILSITQIRKEKLDSALSKIGRIRDLPNLSVKYERALKKVGIDNVDILRQIGAENAIVRFKESGHWCN